MREVPEEPPNTATEGPPSSPFRARGIAFDPAGFATLYLALPDRGLSLDPVDRLAGGGEGGAAVGSGDCDDDAGLPAGDGAGAMLGCGALDLVAVEDVSEDRRDLLFGHRLVGLVVEAVDVAGRALEGDDRAGVVGGDELVEAFGGEQLGGDADVGPRQLFASVFARGTGTPADRRD